MADFVSARAGLVLLVAGLATALALTRLVDVRSGAPRLAMDPSYSRLLPADDPERVYYDEIRELFGGDDVLLLALASPRGVFRPEILDRIRRITRTLEAHESVERVVSLANAEDIRSEAGELRVVEFLDDDPASPRELAELRQRVADNPVWAGTLVSSDATTTAFIVELLPTPEREITVRGIDLELLALARSEEGAGSLAMTGASHVRAAWSRALDADLARVIPLILLAMGLVGMLVFRSIPGVVVPLLTLVVSLVWALGIIAALGLDLNPITVVILPLILIVGFAYVVHVLSAASAEQGEPRERVRQALAHVTLPVVLTAATTAAGFLALLVSPLAAIREFGAYCALGVATTLLASLTFAPALYALLDRRRAARAQRGQRLDALFAGLARFDLRRSTPILWATAAVGAIAVAGATRIEVNTGLVSNLPPEHDTRRDFESIDRSLQGGGLLSIVVESGEPEAFEQPRNLRVLESLQRWLAQQPEVATSTSLADYVKVLHRGFHDDAPEQLRLPDHEDVIAQLLLLGPDEDLEEYADFDYRRAHVLVRSRATDSATIGALVERIRARLAELPPDLEGRVTGNAVLFAHSLDLVAAGQAASLAFAFAMIFAILSTLFLSLRMGFVALLPNALPILVYYGALGLSGTPLNLTTGLVACLVLGIAVDDTTHFMVHFNTQARRHASGSRGVVEALRAVGRPVTITSLALCLGFLGVATADLRSIVEFGVLASFTLAFAWLADVTFTPALAGRLRVVTLWELLTLDLGSEPHRTLPLFAGLSRSQARIAALMMRIQPFAKGDTVLRLGDPGGELFVALDGELQTSYPGRDGPVELRRLGRGDVVGEVGVFRGERSANVVALSDARLLRLDARDLAQLRSRYPRIAARVNENLIRVLADRLVDLTARAAAATARSEPR